LQVMDHGTLTDNNGRKADFRNVIIVMTTNAGAETMNKATIGFTNPRQAGDEMADIKRLFTPEFRNRLDAIVNFRALDEDIILRVVDKFLLQLETQLAEKKVDVTFSDQLRQHLAKKGFDPLMGARPMQRLIQDTIRKALADELLFGRLTEGGRLSVDIDEAGEVLVDMNVKNCPPDLATYNATLQKIFESPSKQSTPVDNESKFCAMMDLLEEMSHRNHVKPNEESWTWVLREAVKSKNFRIGYVVQRVMEKECKSAPADLVAENEANAAKAKAEGKEHPGHLSKQFGLFDIQIQ